MPSRAPPISVGVPIWNAHDYVAEALESILTQRDVRVRVFLSIDGADERSEMACRPFLQDPRVSVVVQRERLGWVRNSALVMHAGIAEEARFGCLHPADDLVLDGYLATLLSAVEQSPRASVAFCDIETFGDLPTKVIAQPSVEGDCLVRQTNLLLRHFSAVAWRGLTRLDALARSGPIRSATLGDFAIDTVWMAKMANEGDLVRVSRALYRKRYHSANTHTAWSRWPAETKLRSWAEHCAQMLVEALKGAAARQSRRLLYDAARVRLLQPEVDVGPYRELIATLGKEERARMLADFDTALGRGGVDSRPLRGSDLFADLRRRFFRGWWSKAKEPR